MRYDFLVLFAPYFTVFHIIAVEPCNFKSFQDVSWIQDFEAVILKIVNKDDYREVLCCVLEQDTSSLLSTVSTCENV